jgi:nitroimidazol reductase NimA-like FMN-containing flavoprotein (pyridoxamine 5'-phosphate oxidase superfamily)
MIRTLASEEIERVLRAEVVGRIGCHAGDRTYIVPVCYVYCNGSIYAHSANGQKIEMMRQNPIVCFEVDHVEDLVNWNSAICWGTFEELQGAEATKALRILRERLESELPRVLEHGELAAEAWVDSQPVVAYRVRLSELSGREERLHWELLPTEHETERAAQSFRSTPAENWLSHERAQQLAEAAGALDEEDIWDAADKLVANRPLDEVTESLTLQGVDADLAGRIVGFLAELRDSARSLYASAETSPLSSA